LFIGECNLMAVLTERRLPIGAELISPGETHFRIWAPKAEQVDVAIEDSTATDARRDLHALAPEGTGYFSGTAPAEAGMLYRYRVNRSDDLHPDPASRWQPQGPHRSSCVVDPSQFAWSAQNWPGIQLKGQVFYEMHIGTFTPDGTWAAAAEELPELKRTGITAIEMMPVADFAGEFGWGYDGVDLFAPCRLYGTPDDLRAFVDRAHSLGIGVILDVVYNHLGPDGNYLGVYSDDYFSKRSGTEWGDGLNFDGRNSGPVREFFLSNARYWIQEFHFDGFRFDATQTIFDNSEEHILSQIAKAARAAAGERSLVLIAENEPQETRLIRPRETGGYGLDGLWNDDLHHTAIVALTGRNPAYYSDYGGSPQEFISAAKYGFLYQGQHYRWQKKRRGTSTRGLSPEQFVGFIENHDQVANSTHGSRVRLTTSPSRYRAMTALLLLASWTPLLFQGQEFGATSPFLYFADVNDELREPVRKGRFDFLKQFPGVESEETQRKLPCPSERDTFERCKLDLSEREKFPEISELYRDLLRLRREDPVFSRQEPAGLDGAVLGPEAFVLRFFDPANDDRLLVVNFGRSLEAVHLPEPLLAPPSNLSRWATLWSSDTVRYGGHGETPVEAADGSWEIPAEAAVVLHSIPIAGAK
jgi:maltooligosyltrehalose trehalohydrolase